MAYYLNQSINGIISAASDYNGTAITLKWAQAYPSTSSNKIAYNIYYSPEPEPDFPTDLFTQAPSFVVLDGTTSADIQDLTPGLMYHFGVRAAEYVASTFDLATLPIAHDNLRLIPSSLLSVDLLASDIVVQLIDSEGFPGAGTIKIGSELIRYSSISGNNLIVAQRGAGGVAAKEHLTDGYDGTYTFSPEASIWPFTTEEDNTRVFQCQSRFDLKRFPYLATDGYHQKITDLLNTDMTVSDVINQNFPPYDFSGYHSNTPQMILSGQCIGSYIGGVRGCIDGYSGSFVIRGVSSVVQNQQRQEVLLNVDGEPVILLKRQWTGVTCTCYIPSQEYPSARCLRCYGSGIVVGWQQFYNPRRSDRKIMVRFDPTVETVDPTDSGLESNSKPNCWTMTVPTIHERDVIVRFDQAENEEFRYEVLNVTRNKFILDFQGLQRFSLQRIRKTDIIYQIPVLEAVNTNSDGTEGVNIFRTLSTSIEMSAGFPPHIHTVMVSDRIISPTQVNGITSIAQGHSHTVTAGIVEDGSNIPEQQSIGHDHTLLWLPP